MVENLRVNLGERSYVIEFCDDLAPTLAKLAGDLTAAGRRFATITDSRVSKHQHDALQPLGDGGPILTIVPGEKSKNLAQISRILEFLAAEKLDRTSVLVAVGGGVVGDVAGYAAASYLRGIEYRQVPTTLLAMVDSSVGGKTGVNLKAGKNLAGAFHQPKGVTIATGVLSTLPRREFAAGCAEIIKYGLLGDRELFERLHNSNLKRTSSDLAPVIRRCCAAKAAIVEADERETAPDGGRALLNLGHTFGHAIEQATSYRSYLHGEAVAIGLCAAADLSRRLGYISEAEAGQIEATIGAHRLPTRLREPIALADLAAAAARDKKVRGGVPRYVVLRGIGQAAVEEVPPEHAAAAFKTIGATE